MSGIVSKLGDWCRVVAVPQDWQHDRTGRRARKTSKLFKSHTKRLDASRYNRSMVPRLTTVVIWGSWVRNRCTKSRVESNSGLWFSRGPIILVIDIDSSVVETRFKNCTDYELVHVQVHVDVPSIHTGLKWLPTSSHGSRRHLFILYIHMYQIVKYMYILYKYMHNLYIKYLNDQ
jgi:hypothetical protein